MAFVYEKIPEGDRKYFNSFNLKSPFTDKLLYSREWTIDREREVFMVGLGGQGTYESEIPMYYALVWGKSVIFLDTFCNGKGDYDTGIEMWWKITKIKAPICLLKDNDKMIEIIKEAFDAMGFAGIRNCVKRVNFEYIAEPVYMQEVK
ncbi:hypothetical protein LY28_03762 [Ruminiclostridium sufflavum DSM 19573]|uniref:Uncharacterized protein n=1 Tax=Ruminiclostridium sufflavum DSM 19573 TaxID=1121337 RepID=A0A318XID7_9FIRM|nr:hypothetical protein [Ruminiclostridium sufflavum]PYG83914.1 hypothetical protein LY28_03762 [Ruminiclostridium sufflavum DSM 19573]